MGARTHDHHCRNCHEWVNGFAVDRGVTCGCDNPDLFYDLNHEACFGLGQCDVGFCENDAVHALIGEAGGFHLCETHNTRLQGEPDE
jgi:hypothetical protein